MKTVFVGGKYIGKNYMEIDRNIRAAEEAAIKLWNAGFGVFCPHLNTAHFEIKAHANEQQYKLFDLLMLERCNILYLLPDWEDSSGARDEQGYADGMNKPTYTDIDILIASEREGEASGPCPVSVEEMS